MSDGELNKQVEEEVMLRVPCDKWKIALHATVVSGSIWRRGDCGHKRCYPRDSPTDYSGSLDAAWLMEEEIKRRKLEWEYGRTLLLITCAHDGFMPEDVGDTWAIIHATPEQRVRAALEAVREKRQ